jgi:hypothetical protein
MRFPFALLAAVVLSITPVALPQLGMAAAYASEEKKEESGDRKVSAPNIVTPVVRNGKLVNYLFVSVEVELSNGADLLKMRDRAHFLRDSLLRASHRTMLADATDDMKLNYGAARQVFWAAAGESLGPANIKKLTITGVDSLKRP